MELAPCQSDVGRSPIGGGDNSDPAWVEQFTDVAEIGPDHPRNLRHRVKSKSHVERPLRLALVKSSDRQLPRDFLARAAHDWPDFAQYANNPSTAKREKTQAFHRARKHVVAPGRVQLPQADYP